PFRVATACAGQPRDDLAGHVANLDEAQRAAHFLDHVALVFLVAPVARPLERELPLGGREPGGRLVLDLRVLAGAGRARGPGCQKTAGEHRGSKRGLHGRVRKRARIVFTPTPGNRIVTFMSLPAPCQPRTSPTPNDGCRSFAPICRPPRSSSL